MISLRGSGISVFNVSYLLCFAKSRESGGMRGIMAVTLNETPSGSRLHIGVFGRTNSGKSSFLNAFTGQQVSIASGVSGTTTDPVYKAMEIYPLGPCVLIDTAGFDDESELGEQRRKKTRLAAEKTELAVLLFSGMPTDRQENDKEAKTQYDISEELYWYRYFREKKTPVLAVVNKTDIRRDAEALAAQIRKETGEEPIFVSAKTGAGIEAVKEALARKIPEDFGAISITGTLVSAGDMALLVMPQDIQAPKGRLILPQVQTIRELLDKRCLVMSVTADGFAGALAALREPPKLIITDSQIFGYIYENKPKESMLTSFSVLFAAYKGDLPYYMEGARAIDTLTEHSRVLIAECCTHAPLKEDIGRVKIPALLKKRFGAGLKTEHVSGTDFPGDLTGYDLIIQCGGCMFNRKYVISRIESAKEQGISMTNYGVAIAHLSGILDKIVLPVDDCHVR